MSLDIAAVGIDHGPVPRPGKSPPKPAGGSPPPGTVLAAPVEGGWAACQVIAHGDGGAFVAALDWYGTAPPTLDELAPPRPLVLTHHQWKGVVQALWVGKGAPPADWVVLGTLPPAGVADRAAYSGWSALPNQARSQWWWDHVLPAAAREHHAACKESRVRVAVCGGRAAVPLGTATVGIGPGKELDHALDEAVDWASLRALGCLSAVEYDGGDGGVLDFVRSSPIVRKLWWTRHGRAAIDVRGLGLLQLTIEAGGPLTLAIDPMGELAVLGDGAGLEVQASGGCQGTHLRLVGKDRPSLPIAGLADLRDLTLSFFAAVDLGAVAGHRDLKRLTIRGGPRLQLENVPALSGLEHLAELEIHGAYTLTSTSLGGLQRPRSVRRVVIDGYRKEEEAAIRRAFAGADELVLRGGKKAAWVEANLDNPFIDWVDDHAAEGKKAARAWTTATVAIAHASSDRQRWDALEEMVATFQAMADRGKLDIDTIRREEIADAFFGLAERAGLAAEEAEARFDAWRDF